MRTPTIRGRISCNIVTDFERSTRVRAVKADKALKAGTAISEKRVGVVWFLLVVILAKESLTADHHKSLFSLAMAPSRKATQPGVAFAKAGDPVFMILPMKNDSKRVLHFALPHPHPAFQREPCPDPIEVSYLCDASRPGHYSVQVGRDMPLELCQGVVKSNTITATITP